MSDDLTADELTAALRGLATANETPPSVAAPEIRRRAVRRGRRRRTALTLGAGAAALALAAFALTLGSGDAPVRREAPAVTAPRLPASPTPRFPASPTPTTPLSTPVTGTVDFGKRALTVDGRVMPITSGYPVRPAAGLLTVAATLDLTRDTVDELAKSTCKVAAPYVVELRGTDNSSLYVGSLTCAPRAGAWIGLDAKNAVWLYHRLRPGDTLSVAVTPSA
ncbi:hypothetical protein ACFOOM_13495 [Streptomyces echinoruber]|uniref:Uncharacterized protein n=1 Tax=Streptomyces echinoruber TaxID=68898 RepID=A0A918RFJ7_9ACTN|nr:hypothetical protein [Streptomyces echinoruber]GGZ95570.1 hypothetical protein GCM10010389_38410 [Streptomyces echinoruber]